MNRRAQVTLPSADVEIVLSALSGDPDLFVSDENPFPTMDDNIWRSGAKGDDEILIETDHPRYRLGSYYVGVYAICDSSFELVARLAEPPIRSEVPLAANSGNGFGTLSSMIAQADLRKGVFWCNRPDCQQLRAKVCQVHIPYACKLLFQELMTMCIAPRIMVNPPAKGA